MSHSAIDTILIWVLRLFAALAGAVVVLILLFLSAESLPALARIGPVRFVSDAGWHPTPAAADGLFNLLPMIWGTFFVALGAVLLAAPAGILFAIFLHYQAPPFIAPTFRRVVEMLAGIPSVVYGFWGLVVLVPMINTLHPPGPSLLAGILILALMITPTIALLADSAIGSVPEEYVRGAVSLGFSRWTTIRGVVLPAARSGLFTGVLLGCARAVGETMAVMMVSGNVVQTPAGLFEPVRTLTANIALEMAYAMDDHAASLFVTGLFLMLVVFVLVALAERISRGGRHAR